MIIPELHRQPAGLDREKHRSLRLALPPTDWSHLTGLNALFLTAAEMAQAASEFPVVFIRAGQDEQGQPDFAPIAVFGLAQGENLYVEADGRWRAQVLPALMSTYPFCVARLPENRYAVCVDQAWVDTHATRGGETGELLFDEAGEPSEFLKRVQAGLERLEGQVDQTRQVVRKLATLDLLREMRFDATLPDGRKLAVDGFLSVDEERVKALPDATVLELHRQGVLGLIHAHWVSLGHMRRLLGWRLERELAKTQG